MRCVRQEATSVARRGGVGPIELPQVLAKAVEGLVSKYKGIAPSELLKCNE